MSNFGFTPSGFVPMLIGDIEQAQSAAMWATVDPNFDMSADQPIGQMASVQAQIGAQLWELLAVVYSGLNPNNAEGMILDGDCAYTGTLRLDPTYSTVIGTLVLAAGANIPVGATANVSGQPLNTWVLLGPCDTTGNLLSGSAIISAGGGTYLGLFQSTTTGPNIVNPGQLTVITAAITGWTSINNVNGTLVIGTNVETDAALGNRRETELSSSGAGTNPSMQAALEKVQGVLKAYVFENDGDTTDGNGVPPHSVHALVYDGVVPAATNQTIAEAIWSNKASGGGTYGATSFTVTDSTGTGTHIINFDRATITRTYHAVTVQKDSTFDVVNGPTAVKNALVAWWASIMGLNVPMNRVRLENQPFNVQGVIDVTAYALDVTATPTATANLPASQYGIYTLAAADIAVTVV